MATFHHAVVKRATKLGVNLIDAEGGVRLEKTGRLSIESFDTAKEALDRFAKGGLDFEARKSNFCGVMVASYHASYESNPHGPGCGDGLDIAMRDAFTGPGGVNEDELRAFGEQIGLWNPNWDLLNRGMRRMNLTNRVRAALRNDAKLTFDIGGKNGRHGVAYNPAKKSRRA